MKAGTYTVHVRLENGKLIKTAPFLWDEDAIEWAKGYYEGRPKTLVQVLNEHDKCVFIAYPVHEPIQAT